MDPNTMSEEAEAQAEALFQQLCAHHVPALTGATAGVMLAAGIISAMATSEEHLDYSLECLTKILCSYARASRDTEQQRLN